ncbi:hypothetical protein [Streptomyces axinellae]|uniref:Integral membrane protein n=1 Tax=Streptomyces axinellae TaxID=552788 RepID=A0ABN3QUG6_9ACTN
MSYPPPPGQDPNNPYAAPQQGAPYGYPQQAPPPQYQTPAPPYGYPQQPGGYPQQPGMPAHPGIPMAPSVSMPGLVVTARVLLFVAGALWGLSAVFVLIGGLMANGMVNDIPGVRSVGGAALGIGLGLFLLFGGLAALHIVPASMFGKGSVGTRVTAIIGASLNGLIALLGMLSAIGNSGGGSIFVSLLWLATAVVTIVFCSMGAAGQWFNRPRY